MFTWFAGACCLFVYFGSNLGEICFGCLLVVWVFGWIGCGLRICGVVWFSWLFCVVSLLVASR